MTEEQFQKLPTPAAILERIDDATLARADSGYRKHLGASEIGEPCVRKLWLSFRWCGTEKFPPRMLRLFERGHREEKIIHQRLREAGFVVHFPDEGNVSDFRFSDYEGHYGGTSDGVVEVEVDGEVIFAGLECKTATLEKFKQLKMRAVKDTYPKHYAQTQSYMGYLQLPVTLYVVECKDNDELYFEWVRFVEREFDKLSEKAGQVVTSEEPPPGVSNNPESYACKYCHFNQICYREKDPEAHCRNCYYGTPTQNGAWMCEKGKVFGRLCKDYQVVPGLGRNQ